MTKLLVTGGAGFIGSNFIHYWLNKYPEDKIINLDKLTYAGNLENLKDLENNRNYQFIKGDIVDEKIVNKLISQVDLVVHFAAESHVDRSIISADEFIKTNVFGTQVLLKAALNNNLKRFHHVSTDEVFGSLPLTDGYFNESTFYDPHSPYAASKAASDHLVRSYYKTYGLPITISNCTNNYGPYQFPEKIIPLFITNLLEKKKVPLYGDGLNVRDWLFVEDHCLGIDLILKKGKIGETYCLGGENELNNINLAKIILKEMNEDKNLIEYVKDRPGHDRRYAMEITKAKKELGFKPRMKFSEGIKKTIQWYKDHQSWWQKIKSGEYRDYYEKWYHRQ